MQRDIAWKDSSGRLPSGDGGASDAERLALDVLLDPVLAHPDLRVRLEVDQRGVDLVVHDALATFGVAHRLQLALEHVARTLLHAELRPGIRPRVLLLVGAFATDLLAFGGAGDDAHAAGADEGV